MSRELVAIPLEQLVEASWNYKGDSEHMMNALVDNITRNGQIINLIVRELPDGMYEVTNGNHRLSALRKIGTAAAVCLNLGPVSKEEAVRIAIETNETNFRANIGKLSKVVTEAIDGTKFNLERHVLPFQVEEVHRFREMQAIDWEQRQKPARKGSAADVKAQAKADAKAAPEKDTMKKLQEEKSKTGPLYECPNCGHQFDEEGHGEPDAE